MTVKTVDSGDFVSAVAADDRRRKRPALGLAMLGFAVVALDAQITNVALPAIHRSLGGGLADLQWIVTSYTLMVSALLLFRGSMADRLGSTNACRSGIGGQLGMASGLLVLALIPLHASVLVVALVMILVGVGGAFTVPPIASLILDSVPGQLGGTASGVLNPFRQIGGSLGVAVFGAVVNSSSTFGRGMRVSVQAPPRSSRSPPAALSRYASQPLVPISHLGKREPP
jgi:MFS family permease